MSQFIPVHGRRTTRESVLNYMELYIVLVVITGEKLKRSEEFRI